jgi:hypothetical protein
MTQSLRWVFTDEVIPNLLSVTQPFTLVIYTISTLQLRCIPWGWSTISFQITVLTTLITFVTTATQQVHHPDEKTRGNLCHCRVLTREENR